LPACSGHAAGGGGRGDRPGGSAMSGAAPGRVWLVGAGPGDPDLLTLKALRLIQTADVVLHDALVSTAILALVAPTARCISVGKRSGRHSRPQGAINALMIEAAQAGHLVVRLKGGDPSLFGRSLEELDALRLAGVPVQVVPGITAASAAVAGAGVALTARGRSRRVQFATAHLQDTPARPADAPALDWARLADPGATTAFYMGKAAARVLSRQLIAAGLAADTPCLLVENASCADERVAWTTLAALPAIARSVLGAGPAVILVGEAMRRPMPGAAARSRALRQATA